MKKILFYCVIATLAGCSGFNKAPPIDKPSFTQEKPTQTPSISELLRQANADLTASLARMQQAIKNKSNDWGSRSFYDMKIAQEKQLQEQLQVVILGLKKQAGLENATSPATGKSTLQQQTIESFNETDIKLSAEKIDRYCKTDTSPTLCTDKYIKANQYCFSLSIKKTPLRNNEQNKYGNLFYLQQTEMIYNIVELKQNFRECIVNQIKRKVP